jgi:hypothetical protein
MKYVILIFFIIWEMPQNILGLITFICLSLSKDIENISFENNRLFIKLKSIAVSLGLFVFWSSLDNKVITISKNNKLHEYGHTIQSRIFGPLYLLCIGIPSIIRVLYGCIYYRRAGKKWSNYYQGYPENWADKLGGAT